ncbi:MAG: divalent-cation tolerance protein CutA [Thermoplasmatales archaeon]|nr:divalent-cation tolerance protein CutA [Thermoplasmatales archaeon]
MHFLVITTCSRKDEEKIKNALLNEKGAACISSFEVKSRYIWHGKIEEENEIMLFIKTNDCKKAEEIIRKNHSYEIPEIICIEIKGYEKYLKWMDEVIK